MMDEEIDRPPIGSRVKMSELGAARCPSYAGRTGIVVGWGRSNISVSVRFDGNRTPTPLHPTYVEAVRSTRSSAQHQ